MTKTFNLTQEQIAFLREAIALASPQMIDEYFYDDEEVWVKGWISADSEHKLAEGEVNATISMFSEELK